MRARLLPGAALGLLLLVLPGTLNGQDAPEVASLDRFAEEVATLWARGDAAGLARRFGPDGVLMDVGGERPGTMGARHAAAALRKLFAGFEATSVEVAPSTARRDSDRAGYLDLTWSARPRGLRDPVTHTVFIGVRSDAGGWHIREIRIRR